MNIVLRSLVRIAAAPLTSVDRPRKADAVVVLGAPLLADGSLTPQAEERVQAGVDVYRRGLAPIICLAGGHGPAAIAGSAAESEGMARWVRRMGVPEEAIVVDRASTCTNTNAVRTAELLLPAGRRRVWLVTQRFHTRRAKLYFRRAGFEPLGWPIEGGVEARMPGRALRWVAREYAAWALAGWRALRG